MIRLTRINHTPLILNAELIEHVESTPDTVICLTTGVKFIARESPDEVIDRVVAYRRAIHYPHRLVVSAGRGQASTSDAAGFEDSDHGDDTRDC